jgi:multicomponent K+:H+ antiporter subunit G
MNTSASDIIVSILVLFGAALMLIGAFGLFRLPDIFMRLHGPSKASTLGIGAILIGSSVHFSVRGPALSLHEILITLFLFITSPVSAYLISKVAIRMRLPTRTRGSVPDDVPAASPHAASPPGET